MSRERHITRQEFEALLAWLDPDRERGAEKYEEIRRRLIKILRCRGCGEAEALADETIDRVAEKVAGLAAGYQGDPSYYFYGVAHKVFLESVRKGRAVQVALPPPPPNDPADSEREHDCLERCLATLPQATREMILQYYGGEKGEKIRRRRELASGLGVAPNALRIRAHRVRASLYECVRECLGRRAPD